MGMYDYIICRYPLPTAPPAFCASPDHQYQTKSLECQLATYEITGQGELKHISSVGSQKFPAPERVPFNGVLEFYDGNVTACAYGMGFTPNGEDDEWVTYEATFINGVVQQIVETERTRKPALSRDMMTEIDARFDKNEPEPTMTEPEVGQRMYFQIGLSNKGFPVTVLAKTKREWAVADDKGTIQKLRPSDLGRRLFHSKEESDAANAWRENSWKEKTAYAKELLRQRKKTNKEPGA